MSEPAGADVASATQAGTGQAGTGQAGTGQASTAQPGDGPPSADPARPELVRSVAAGGAATITLNSPGNANALSTGLPTQLQSALDAALADPPVRGRVLPGAGRGL